MLACASLAPANAGADVHPPHFAPRAKRVIWLFMHGGPSHVDLLDPKPTLTKYSGQTLPESFGNVMTRRNVKKNPLLAPIRRFRPRGRSGLEISDFLPNIAEHADDLCVIRSMHGDSVNHPQSVYQMNTGSILMGNPSVGSWVAYGLGSENQNMPAFVVLPDPGGGLKGGPPAWGNGYLPASYQGVTMRPGSSPILDLQPQPSVTAQQQQLDLSLIQKLNRRHLEQRELDDRLTARVKAYELAFRMQSEAPELVDIQNETQQTKQMYGIDQKETREFGERCLLARRMLESGVRFVQLYSGDTNGWDAHANVEKNHTEYCRRTDKPVAGLLQDLKQRGLMEDTLVIWGGEFGRMPMSEQGKGRDHNPWGYSVWLAGAGIRGGRAFGATDEIGLRAVSDKVSVTNFHATLLHLLGLDHNDLTYFHNGLDKRLTGPDEAEVVQGIIR
ncbi:putative sulfatase [Rhodopirellula islandica]|uniref:Sulfatase n=2 Tax=Rhodopirellula islandica TaxID=595434 RepID=A0A0J1BF93_RHOIS|nr:putative sulfatase [Rhodopirellula islandica]